jgi:hypothetical protein
MDFFQNIPGVEVALTPTPKTFNRPKYNTELLSARETAQMRLARPENFCGHCNNLRWPHLGTSHSTEIVDLERSKNEGRCYTCGLLWEWVGRLVRGRVKVKSLTLKFRETLEIELTLESGTMETRYPRWQLHAMLSTCTFRF